MTWAIIVVVVGYLLIIPKTTYADILMNEIMANVTSGEQEWIEFYNTSSSAISISGWTIEEKTGTDLIGTKSHTIPDLNIPGNGFKVFEFSTSSLNNSGDIITLKDNTGNIKDSYQYSSSNQNKTFGRQPDGGNWNSSLDPTKEGRNGGSSSTPSPTSTPTQTSAFTPSPPSSSNSSIFTISNTPSQINSDQQFSITVNLSLPASPNTNFYLKGAFKKSESSNYFGLTKVSGSWIKNGSSYTNQFPITTDSAGNWSGDLEVKPDAEDSGFSGTDNYIFKIGRYKESDNPSVIWSNEVTIKIISVEASSEGGSTTTTGTSATTKLTPSPTAKSGKATSRPTRYDSLVYHTSSVAGATSSATPSNEQKTEVKQQQFFNLNIWVILGIFLILTGFGSIGFIYLRSKKSI